MSKNFAAIFTILTFFLSSYSSSALADSPSPYFIENVSANAVSKSAGDAKTLATTSARRDAFLILLTRLSLAPALADSISNDDIFDMVLSEQITEEKIAGNNYSATFHVKFAKNAVDKILKAKTSDSSNAPVVEPSEESYLIIPVKVLKKNSPDKYLLWESNNDWRSAIGKTLREKSLSKFIMPDDDIANISVLNHDMIDKIEYQQIESIFSRYKASAAYIIFFYYDSIENKASITVQNIRKLQKKQVKLSFVNVDRLAYDALLKKVSEKTIEYLIGSQSASNLRSNNRLVKIEVPITSLGNWLMVKSKLESSNLISQLNIESISRDYVNISVNYLDYRVDIIDSFTKSGFFLDRKNENSYLLNLSPSSNKQFSQ